LEKKVPVRRTGAYRHKKSPAFAYSVVLSSNSMKVGSIPTVRVFVCMFVWVCVHLRVFIYIYLLCQSQKRQLSRALICQWN